MFGIFLACWYSLKPKEEAIIAPGPVYGPFFENVACAGGKAVFNVLNETDHRFDLDDLKKKITRRTRLLMVCNPHNPTGRVFTREELEGIAFLAKKYNLTVFADELYEDLVYEGEHISIASLSEDMAKRTLTVFGFSKAFSAGGLRVAYCVNQGEIMKVFRTRLPLMIGNTDRLVQAAAKEALTGAQGWLDGLRTHLRSMRDYSMQRMNALGQFELIKPEAGFYLFPRMISKRMNSVEMASFLRQKARVAVVPGVRFGKGGEGHIRINFGTSKKILTEALDRIEKALLVDALV
jgi:aspartate/methionine/tyrosine aminotransferase